MLVASWLWYSTIKKLNEMDLIEQHDAGTNAIAHSRLSFTFTLWWLMFLCERFQGQEKLAGPGKSSKAWTKR
jgi:hypothetical protein